RSRRRFAARWIPRAQAESSAGIGIEETPGSSAGRPTRSLHTLRDLLDFGDGSYGPGAAAATALAGFVALLYFSKDTKNSAGGITGVEATKEVPHVVLKEGDLTRREDVGLEDLKVDEEAMQSRFKDWMKEYGRSYKSEEEKARRYQIFKEGQIICDMHNKRYASKPACFGTTEYSDWTDEEWSRSCGCDEAIDWEEARKIVIAEGRLVTDQDTEEDVLARLLAKKTKDVSDKAIKK
ncbi:unnamed protein product, partial [Urochloa humidicola]